jgi:hypothetical protein
MESREHFIGCQKCEWSGVKLTPCPKHKRFLAWQRECKSRCLPCPTFEQMERMFAELKGMRCPTCNRRMLMSGGLGVGKNSRVVSLNHRHDGGFDLMCIGCNISHRHIPNDGFYELAKKLRAVRTGAVV